jgi:hypothetical protein
VGRAGMWRGGVEGGGRTASWRPHVKAISVLIEIGARSRALRARREPSRARGPDPPESPAGGRPLPVHLGGDAAHVQARPAQRAAPLHARGLEAQLAGLDGRDVATCARSAKSPADVRERHARHHRPSRCGREDAPGPPPMITTSRSGAAAAKPRTARSSSCWFLVRLVSGSSARRAMASAWVCGGQREGNAGVEANTQPVESKTRPLALPAPQRAPCYNAA